MKSYFEIENLKINFSSFEGEKAILDIEHLVINKGKTLGLVGESGTGKSILAQSILRLLSIPPGIIKSGKILFNGEDLLNKSDAEMRKIRGKKISMIFQDPMSTLNPVFTVGTQITQVIRQNQGVSKNEANKIAQEKIELVKLPDVQDVMKSYPHELSGGQRQRIIIAIALSCDAEFLIADEPTRNLDVTIQAGILKLISKLQKELGVTVLFIANNLGLISATCDDLAILHEGRIVEIGTTKEVLKTPLHPYTKAFIQVMPKDKKYKIDIRQFDQNSSNSAIYDGCQYVHMCQEKGDDCLQSKPKFKRIGKTHVIACHRY